MLKQPGKPIQLRAVQVASSVVATLDYDALAVDVRKQSPCKSFDYQWPECQSKINIEADKGIPAELTHLAARHAPALAATLQRAVPRMLRNQHVGALDSSKLVRLAAPTSRKAFERDIQIAYRRRGTSEKQLPLRIAIVGDFNWTTRKANPEYTPKLARLIHIISEAAAMAGMQCGAYGARGRLHSDNEGVFPWAGAGAKPQCVLALLKRYDRRISPQTLASILDHNGFIMLFRRVFQKWGAGSVDGTGGIDYAREVDGANFVVAIGDLGFGDKAKADVYLRTDEALESMVDTIHRAMGAKMATAA